MVWPVTIAVVGTGLRGYTFAGYAQRFPDRVRAVAVADPRVERRDVLADRLGVTADHRFVDWRELAARPPLADAVVVTTPDHEHVGPARRFAELGYHVLLEKPIAPTAAECVALVEAVEATGVIFAVCHVLRYAAYTDAVRQASADCTTSRPRIDRTGPRTAVWTARSSPAARTRRCDCTSGASAIPGGNDGHCRWSQPI